MKPPPRSDTRNRRAAVLILVLWAIAILALLAGGLSFAIRQDLAIANIQRDRLAAHWAARAGAERAIAMLMDDTGATDSLDETWANNEAAFKSVELSTGVFSVLRDGHEWQPLDWYGVNDECGKLNVSVATREQLMRLPHMTEPVAGAIIDWRDSDEQPQADGVERGHYESLPHPYRIRNGPLLTVRELMLVRGVTPELFWGEDTNGNGRLDPNENDGDASEPPDNADGRLDRGWYAFVTVYSFERNVSGLGEDRVNIKSADAGTLAQRLGLENWAAESIVRHRNQKQFNHLVDLLSVQRDASVERGSPENDINTRSDSERDQPVTQSIFRRIVDSITLSDEKIIPGRVNINTAPREVLVALAGEDLAEAIIAQRTSGGMFTSIADLLDISGMTREKFGEMENSLTVRSNVFHINSYGQSVSGLADAMIECVVDRSGRVPKVLYWRE